MWSIGCILAEMVRKKALFPGNTTIEQIQYIMGTIERPPWDGKYLIYHITQELFGLPQVIINININVFLCLYLIQTLRT